MVVENPWYAYPNATDTDGFFEFFRYVNQTVSEGLFFPAILLVIWVISFFGVFSATGSTRPAAARGFTFASFITSVLSIMLATMGFLNPKFMYLPFILLAAGVVWIRLESPSME